MMCIIHITRVCTKSLCMYIITYYSISYCSCTTHLHIDGHIPPNSNNGYTAVTHLLNTSTLQHSPFNLSHALSYYDYNLCNNEPFYFSDRPYDWLNYSYSSTFQHSAVSLLSSRNPKCVKLVGFFQNYPLLCRDDIRRLWSTRLVGTAGDKTYRYTYICIYSSIYIQINSVWHTCVYYIYAYCQYRLYIVVFCINI